MKHGDRKEDENGWKEWHQPEGCIEGWWSRIEDNENLHERCPMTCPSCSSLLDNWNSTSWFRWGVCYDCYYNFLEGRRDLPKMNNVSRAEYCHRKIEEKKKIK